MTTPLPLLYREISLTKGQVALVSPHRYEEIKAFKWFATFDRPSGHFYALRNTVNSNGKRFQLSMHRQIMGLGYGDRRQVDHIDRLHTLNNTDENLRIVERWQNARNQGLRSSNASGYKGVFFDNNRGRWVAKIVIYGKQKHLGCFAAPETAYAAYCKAAKAYFGEFAYTI